MTHEFWNAQFQFSAILPDFEACLADLAARSDAFARGRVFNRMPYGPDPRQWIELTRGTGAPDILPVVIHGGYWRALKAENHRAMMQGLTGLGAQVGNVEYRLMPHVRLNEVVTDVTAGLSLLADRHPNSQLLLIGHSAGAHLAISALDFPKLAARVAGVIAMSGIYELWPVTQCFLQNELGLTPSEVDAFSHTPERPRPPVLYLTGADETYEFRRQSARMAQGSRTAWQHIDNTHHLTVPLAATTETAARAALTILRNLETAS